MSMHGGMVLGCNIRASLWISYIDEATRFPAAPRLPRLLELQDVVT